MMGQSASLFRCPVQLCRGDLHCARNTHKLTPELGALAQKEGSGFVRGKEGKSTEHVLPLLRVSEPIRAGESTSSAVSTRVMDGGRTHGGFLCHLEARLTLTPSTTTLRDTACLEKCRNETYF